MNRGIAVANVTYVEEKRPKSVAPKKSPKQRVTANLYPRSTNAVAAATDTIKPANLRYDRKSASFPRTTRPKGRKGVVKGKGGSVREESVCSHSTKKKKKKK